MLDRSMSQSFSQRDFQSSIDLDEEPDFSCLKPHGLAITGLYYNKQQIELRSLPRGETPSASEFTQPPSIFEPRVHHEPSDSHTYLDSLNRLQSTHTISNWT